ncbi:exodeoxyribonuclease V subunit beta [Neisseria weaveri]|uniref:exodeoxyribonuclease V subunit beta n=1 Tax=Neisseria weaveri TaxID=28091 RepID=UPI000D324739|nr:exodeoxyribonuclease V subunit beta [Neisseria weaveri]
MHTATPFTPLTIDIQNTSLIEASAGTGKTYGIAALFARLVLLEKMPVESILVVTFTKDATAELKTRLRARLDNLLHILEKVPDAAENSDGLMAYCADKHPKDAFIPALLSQALKQEAQAKLILRLKAAIVQFDNAAIFTIHGFCQRLLRDYAFLCQVPFDMELSSSGAIERFLTPAQDFWRTRVATDPVLANLAFENKATPRSVLEELIPFIGRPYLKPATAENRLADIQEAVETVWQTVRSRLPELEETFWKIHPGLNGSSYRQKNFTEQFAEWKKSAERNTLPGHSKYFEKLDQDALTKGLKKGVIADEQAFAELAVLAELGEHILVLEEAEEEAFIRLKLDLLDYLKQNLAEQKKSRKERSFDDLLTDVHHALTATPYGEKLAQTISENWRVALIDEFQDTDPLQYEIFSTAFIRQGTPLFLVGDPKQAIYKFRGADIYAYLKAARDAEHHYTLATNHRSHQELVGNINRLFMQKTHPFVLNDIRYPEVEAARKEGRLNPKQASFRVRWLIDENGDTPAQRDPLRRLSARYCADEIADALNRAAKGEYRLGDRALEAGDIAVLVRKGEQGRLIARELKKRNIQSVIQSRESVFAAEETLAIAALIRFWLEPQKTEFLRFVLGSVLFQYTADQLYELNQNEQLLSEWTDAAAEALEIWQQRGFYAAIQYFSTRYRIESRLLAGKNERSLTNFNQVLELLTEEDEESHSPFSLLQWLQNEINAAEKGNQDKEKTLRLESDEELVKIVTIHASKGLQYPLVYCPFAWEAQKNQPEGWQILQRSDQTAELCYASQLSEDDKQQLNEENLGEDLRLLYVALTRAEEQVTVYAAYCNDTPNNSLAYLLNGNAETRPDEVEAAYSALEKSNRPSLLKQDWQRFLGIPEPQSGCEWLDSVPTPSGYTPDHNRQTAYHATALPKRSFEFIKHTSFTALSSQTSTIQEENREELQPAIDPAETELTVRPSEISAAYEVPPDSIHHFPRGTKAGVCLHEMLEHLDFSKPAAVQSEQTAACLQKYGFDASWLPAVETMLEQTRLSKLFDNYALADIPPKKRLPEMAFTLYMEQFDLAQLRRWFECSTLPGACLAAAQHLDFQTVRGFLNGFIDMVCQYSDGHVCIIDYKSNHLGGHAGAYTRQAMDEAVAGHHYYLQALIYSIAVARHFQVRGRPLHGISVRYLFLRGLDGTDNGIWQWDIDTADLQEWLQAPAQ